MEKVYYHYGLDDLVIININRCSYEMVLTELILKTSGIALWLDNYYDPNLLLQDPELMPSPILKEIPQIPLSPKSIRRLQELRDEEYWNYPTDSDD